MGFWGASVPASPLVLTPSPNALSVNTSGSGPGAGTTGSTTVSVSGGTGPYTASWFCTNGWVANSAALTTTFTSDDLAPGTGGGNVENSVATCTVTDAAGVSNQTTVNLTHTRTYPALGLSITPNPTSNFHVTNDTIPYNTTGSIWTAVGSGGSGSFTYSMVVAIGSPVSSSIGTTSGGISITHNHTVDGGIFDYYFDITVTDTVTTLTLTQQHGFRFQDL